ncbi:MAG: exodeoxyribonuclease VII small subunit, partial [Puniceicoccales bacterium]|nr:exodeoxyribonuclease VII small subunit [Puniceicoccales bacterium]
MPKNLPARPSQTRAGEISDDSGKSTEKNSSGPSFEQKLQHLEQVVGEMEAGELTLEMLLKKYHEGQALLTACQAELDRAELLVRPYG